MPTSFGALAVDTTANLSVSQWECLNQQGAKLMLGHIYKSSGTFDEVGFQNLYNAYTGKSFFMYNYRPVRLVIHQTFLSLLLRNYQ